MFACFSFVDTNNENLTYKNYTNKKHIIITYNTLVKYENVVFEIPDLIREECLGKKFIFLKKITDHNLILLNNQELWEVIDLRNITQGNYTLGGDLEEDPDKPTDYCSSLKYQYIPYVTNSFDEEITGPPSIKGF